VGTSFGAKSFIDVEPAVLAAVSNLGSGTRVIGVYEQRFLDAPVGPLCVYLHGLSDPGNVGTILRAAEAFGASCVALGPGCADPHSPKAVRASMGAIFSVQLARVPTIAQLPGERVALVAHAGQPLGELAVEQPLTLLIGAERQGLPEEVVSRCEHRAHIPIRSESLNAAMAATIGLYEMSDWEGIGARPPRLAGVRSPGNKEGPDRSRETRASGAGRFGDASEASAPRIGPHFGQPASGDLRNPPDARPSRVPS
jgi:TrmH family RNA methyltransferase